MRILFMGDSITDMQRQKDVRIGAIDSYGYNYTFFIEGELATKFPKENEIITRGISGNRVVDIYARIKGDCWNHNPDLVSILIGVNDLWHEIVANTGVELDRFERVYDMYLTDTKKALPNVKFMILEPFVLKGKDTEADFEKFALLKEYAKIVKKLAEKHNAVFVPLQDVFDKALERAEGSHWLSDGVHPTVAGAKLISERWLEKFYSEILGK